LTFRLRLRGTEHQSGGRSPYWRKLAHPGRDARPSLLIPRSVVWVRPLCFFPCPQPLDLLFRGGAVLRPSPHHPPGQPHPFCLFIETDRLTIRHRPRENSRSTHSQEGGSRVYWPQPRKGPRQARPCCYLERCVHQFSVTNDVLCQNWRKKLQARTSVGRGPHFGYFISSIRRRIVSRQSVVKFLLGAFILVQGLFYGASKRAAGVISCRRGHF